MRVGEGTYLLPARTRLGVLVEGNHAVLVDTGPRAGIARKALEALQHGGLHLQGIINTHAHVDHSGGNAWLVSRTKARVHAAELEAPLIEYPILKPLSLFGAHPPINLRNRFLMTAACPVDRILWPGPVNIGGIDLEVVALPGHTMGHIGIARRGVIFAGDAFIGKPILERNPIPYNVDTRRALESIESLLCSPYDSILASHGDLLGNHRDELILYKQRLLEVIRVVLEGVTLEPSCTDVVLTRTCEYFAVGLKAPTQYYLMRTAISSVLSYLRDLGEVAMACEGGQMLWYAR